MPTVSPPGLRYSGLYYPELLQDLLVWRRANLPELDDEDPNEPLIQLLRAFALTGHYSNVLIDHVAQECLLPTARLLESVRGLLALIGYRLRQPSPSSLDLLLKLAAPLTAATSFPARMRFGTQPAGDAAAVVFESGAAALTVARTDRLTQAWEYDASGPTWTDRTAALNGLAGPFDPWGGVPAAGDCLYLGHSGALWDEVVLTLAALGDLFTVPGWYVWEYYDGQLDRAYPTGVADLGGGQLRFDLTGLLGAVTRAGAQVQVRCRVTGKAATVASAWVGGKNTATTTYIGQGAPSLLAADYLVGAAWREPAAVTETVDGLVRTLRYDLPEGLLRRWQTVAVNGTTAYWLRLRVVGGCAALDSPQPSRARIEGRGQWLKMLGTQGESASDDPAGTSSGLADQTFTTVEDDVIEGTLAAYADEGAGDVAYAVVDDFLASDSEDRHVAVAFDADGRATVTFGDGTSGRIPPAGSVIRLDYRHGASPDGNVGAGEVTVNRTGAAYVTLVSNPRPGEGWQAADGADAADLARVKVAGPASLRNLGRALTVEDVDALAVEFAASDGTRPCSRAYGIEEALGPKTVKVLAVGTGGDAVPDELLAEMDLYFNGDRASGEPGLLVLGTEATCANYTPHPVDVTATLTGGSVAKAVAALQAFLNALAVDADGNYVHAFGGTVYRERLVAELFAADPLVRNVVLTMPAADVVLGAEELPAVGTLTVVVA